MHSADQLKHPFKSTWDARDVELAKRLISNALINQDQKA